MFAGYGIPNTGKGLVTKPLAMKKYLLLSNQLNKQHSVTNYVTSHLPCKYYTVI